MKKTHARLKALPAAARSMQACGPLRDLPNAYIQNPKPRKPRKCYLHGVLPVLRPGAKGPPAGRRRRYASFEAKWLEYDGRNMAVEKLQKSKPSNENSYARKVLSTKLDETQNMQHK